MHQDNKLRLSGIASKRLTVISPPRCHKKADPKFHSLVLSPSVEELALVSNNAQALERYTQNVMDLYTKNFNLKNGRELGEANLMWAATIRQERTNRETDAGVQ